jgi:hypothetical protein
MHGGITSRPKESHPSTIRRPNHLKTGLGVYVTSCLLIPPASFGASGKTFPRCGGEKNLGGTSSPHVKLKGDFGKAIEVIRIGDRFPFRVFAKNSWPCNFRLLQQNRPIATFGPETVVGRFRGHSGSGRTCSLPEPVANDPTRTPSVHRSMRTLVGRASAPAPDPKPI